IGVSVPLILDQFRGSTVPGVAGPLTGLSGGLGDIGLSPKLALTRADRVGVDVAVIAALTLPTGRDDYRGDKGVTLTPAVALSRAIGAVRVAGNLGWRIREASRLGNLRVDDELVTELGLGVRLTDVVGADLGLSAATAAAEPFDSANQTHAE